MNRWSRFEMTLAGVVAAVWVVAFLGGFGEPNERLMIQAAMMVVLGAVFGRRILREDDDE